MQSEMSAIPPTDLSGDDRAEWNSATRPGTIFAGATEDTGSSKGVFLLVLNNGSSHAATDYWVADGYLEYVSPDGTRSHIPLEALDLQNTVGQNAPRGLPFVLRSTPAQNRYHGSKIEVIVSSATDISTAGTALIAGASASGLFMLTRHGRDVVLPKFTETDIIFDRPVSLSAAQPVPVARGNRDQTRLSMMEQ